MMARTKKTTKKRTPKKAKAPIAYWSHSSLLAYLRNPLAWYKRYVKKIYDTPRNPASIVGSAGHLALQHFYAEVDKATSLALGLEYMRSVPDFEIQFGRHKTRRAQKAKRASMEREYVQATSFYLARAPRHKVVGIEVKGMARVKGLPLPIKAISDLVVESKGEAGALDIVDHKFVESFSSRGGTKTIFLLQAIFNYYTVRELYGKSVRRFLVIECKKRKNADGSAQLRRHVFHYSDMQETFDTFHRLLRDASTEIQQRKVYLPNPSDMFEGEHSFDIYRLGLLDEERSTDADSLQ
jgi:hypothetical protein